MDFTPETCILPNLHIVQWLGSLPGYMVAILIDNIVDVVVVVGGGGGVAVVGCWWCCCCRRCW